VSNKNFKKVNVLGVKIDDLSMDQAVELVEGWLKRDGKHYIVTPNPEFVMAAQYDPEFKKILNDADLAIPDGVGLKIGSDLENTTPGVDFLDSLCKEAAGLGFTTGFLGGRDGVAKKAAECLQKKYPGLKVVLAEDGPEVDINGKLDVRSEKLDKEVGSLKLDNQKSNFQYHDPFSNFQHPTSAIDLLFVAFGQVKQEKWIAKNLLNLPVKVMMGVGGSFDEISGRVPRIPGWVRKAGLKWLVRLILQPWRIKRQLALLKFVWLVLVYRKGS